MSPKTFNRQLGKLGERLAEDFLINKKYKFLERNFSTRFGEIDLICLDHETLVFVEVKTKKGLLFGNPEEMFTKGKRNKVRQMAQSYLNGKDALCRIDMVAVVLDEYNRPVRITHYQNVI